MSTERLSSSRRDFLKGGALVGAAAIAASVASTSSAAAQEGLTPYLDADVVTADEREANVKKLLVVVDYQVDFVSGVFGNDNAQAIETAVYDKIAAYKQNGDVVLYTMDTHPADTYADTREGKRVAPHCIPGTEGWELYGSVREALAEGATMIKKGTYGSSQLPSVIEHIIHQGTSIDTIELIGVATTACVINNAVILLNFFPDINIQVSRTATASSTDEAQETVLAQLGRFGIEIID